jgi:hypothetical protein
VPDRQGDARLEQHEGHELNADQGLAPARDGRVSLPDGFPPLLPFGNLAICFVDSALPRRCAPALFRPEPGQVHESRPHGLEPG